MSDEDNGGSYMISKSEGDIEESTSVTVEAETKEEVLALYRVVWVDGGESK